MRPRAGAVHLFAASLTVAAAFWLTNAQAAPGILYQVTNVNDSGPGSLRQVIHDANSDGQESGIRFAIPAEQGRVIAPFTDLPPLLELTRITGPTDADGQPIIDLSGAAPFAFGEVGLRLQAPGCTVRNLKITGWPTAGIDITGGGATVSSCRIGSASSPNAVGIRISSNSNIIGGLQEFERNVISGNSVAGMEVLASFGNVIRGNRIGTDLAGMAALPNGNGIILGGRNVIGGFEPGAANLISGNTLAGIKLDGAQESEVLGNIVGLAIDGATPVPNNVGVLVENSTQCLIGITANEGRNVISGNTQTGVEVHGFGAESNQISGNLIGTDVTGTMAAPNGWGVHVNNPLSTRVGGTPAERNLISGNLGTGIRMNNAYYSIIASNWIGTDVSGLVPLPNGAGIEIWDCHTTNVNANVISANRGAGTGAGIDILDILDGGMPADATIVGNFIGTDATGLTPMGNGGDGISIRHARGAFAEESLSRIGGPTPAEANVIAANGRHGVFVRQPSITIQSNSIGIAADGITPMGNGGDGIRVEVGDEVRIRTNRIAHNGGLGIDLEGDGVTVNDPPTDGDTGANLRQNWPVLGSAHFDEQLPRFTGLLTSTPNTMHVLEFFLSGSPDTSGHGEGQHPLFTINATTDATGLATFNQAFAIALPPGRYVTATATDPDGNTSEFSMAIRATGRGPLITEIVDRLLGRIPDPGDLDLNASGTVEAGDLVTRVNTAND